jgi:hypothetical protein
MHRRIRFVRPTGNALRRRSDRIESAIVAGLLALFVLGGPVSAIVAGSLVDHAMQGEVRAEQSWQRVTATLAHPGTPRLQATASDWVVQSVRASWMVGGRTHTGYVPLASSPGKAKTVSVWVSPRGALTGPPSAYADLHLAVGLAAAGAALVLAAVLFLAGLATRLVLNRRRMADWDRAWRAVGPQWSRQL